MRDSLLVFSFRLHGPVSAPHHCKHSRFTAPPQPRTNNPTSIMPALLRTRGHTGSEEARSTCDAIPDPFVQNLFVLCHGEYVKPQKGSERPWDPPLTERGKLQAWRVGRTIRQEDWNITRVVMSPSLRCVQSAVEVIAGMCMMPSTVTNAQACDSPHLSTIKASIECGLAEAMRGRGVPYPSEAADKDLLLPWTLELTELYSMLPTEILDPSFQQITQKLPSGRETSADVQYQYTSTFQRIANRYSYENILCVTHGEGVMQSVSMMWPRAEVYGVAYCGYAHAQRPNFEYGDGSGIINGDWELLTESGSASGVWFSPSD